jgi:hypothetical protein
MRTLIHPHLRPPLFVHTNCLESNRLPTGSNSPAEELQGGSVSWAAEPKRTQSRQQLSLQQWVDAISGVIRDIDGDIGTALPPVPRGRSLSSLFSFTDDAAATGVGTDDRTTVELMRSSQRDAPTGSTGPNWERRSTMFRPTPATTKQ